MRKLTTILLLALLLIGCSKQPSVSDKMLVVSIVPLKYVVDNIVGDDFDIEVVVPAGASPETYEPTPAQMEKIESAKMIFAVGLMGFEQTLIERMTESTRGRYVALADGIEADVEHHHHHHDGCGHGGANPHLWTSPRELRLMADNAYKAIAEVFPDSTKYERAYRDFCVRLDSLDAEVARRAEQLECRSFVIYHPTFHYMAEHYGLEEIAVENHGKEPSVKHMQSVVTQARRAGVSKVFYQREFPRTMVETVAAELGVEPIEVDILSEDVEGMILNFMDKLAE